jgi:hypothetical protein
MLAWISCRLVSVDRLTSPDEGSDGAFGAAVAIDQSTAAVGAPSYDEDTGRVYVYSAPGESALASDHWSMDGFLEANRTAAYFGSSIAICRNRIYVGAPGYEASSGAVFVFDLKLLLEIDVLAARDPQPNALFGMSCSSYLNSMRLCV